MTTKFDFGAINPKEYTLLIVDDEVDLREILSLQFRRDGFQVLEAGNGHEAFAIVQSTKVDMVISDSQMPDGDGIELLEQIRKRTDEIPVILFMTCLTKSAIEEAYTKGAEAIFAKPFDRQILLRSILQALEAPKQKGWRQRQWRGEVALPVELRVSTSELSQFGQVLNLSLGGIFVALDQEIPQVGAKVSFKIQITEGPGFFIETQGVVRWSRSDPGDFPWGFGVEFVDLSAVSRAQVMELVNYLKTHQMAQA